MKAGRRSAPTRDVTTVRAVTDAFGPAVWAGLASCGHPFRTRRHCKEDPPPARVKCRRCKRS